MLKLIKKITIPGIIALVILVGGSTYALANGYLTWGGEDDLGRVRTILASLDNKLNEAKQNSDQKDQAIRDKEQEIRNKEQEIRDKENQIRDKENQILDRENQIRDKENQLRDKDNQINAKTQEINEKNRQIDSLNNEIANMRNELNSLNQSKDALTQEIANLKVNMEQVQNDNQEKDALLNKARADVKALKEYAEQIERKYN